MESCPVPLFDRSCVVRGICHVVGCAATLARMCSMSVLELHCLGAACQPVLPSLSLYISPSLSPSHFHSTCLALFKFYDIFIRCRGAGRRFYMEAICQCTYGWQYSPSSYPPPPLRPCPVICLRWLQSECPRVVKQKWKHVDFICLLRFCSF